MTNAPVLLEDHYRPSFAQSEGTRLTLSTEEALKQELVRLSQLAPRVVILRRDDGSHLEVGVGGEWMFVRHYWPGAGSLPSVYLAGNSTSPPTLSFSFEGQPHIVPGRYLVPASKGIEVVLHLLRGEEPPAQFVSEYDDRIANQA